jgi:hypothetical protein
MKEWLKNMKEYVHNHSRIDVLQLLLSQSGGCMPPEHTELTLSDPTSDLV